MTHMDNTSYTGVEATTLAAQLSWDLPVPLRDEWINISQVYILQYHTNVAYFQYCILVWRNVTFEKLWPRK